MIDHNDLKTAINEAVAAAKQGHVRVDRCGEIIQRKFARDFANRVVWCYDGFRPGDTCLQQALQVTDRWLRGIDSSEQLAITRNKTVAARGNAFRQKSGLATFMRVLEIFATTTQTFRKFYLRISAVKTFRTVLESMVDASSLDVERVADEARQAICVHAFYERPVMAVRHIRRSYDIVPAVFKTIREAEHQWQSEHVADCLQRMNEPAAVRMLFAHESGDLAARAYFWDWCEERGIDLCPQTAREDGLEFASEFSVE